MTEAQLKEFFNRLSRECNVRFVGRSLIDRVLNLIFNRLISRFAPTLKGLSPKLRPCAMGSLLFLDFEPGDPSVPWQRQITVATHEAQHALDIRKYKKRYRKMTNWYRNYFTSSTFRAVAEGGPTSAEAEVLYYLTGIYPDPICDFNAYLILKFSAIDAFKKGCEVRKKEVMELGRGHASQYAARKAITILKELGI